MSFYIIKKKDGSITLSDKDLSWEDLEVGDIKQEVVDINELKSCKEELANLKESLRDLSSKSRLTQRNYRDEVFLSQKRIFEIQDEISLLKKELEKRGVE